MKLSNNVVEDNLLIGILFFAPFALGSVHTWAYCILALASLILFNIHFLSRYRESASRHREHGSRHNESDYRHCEASRSEAEAISIKRVFHIPISICFGVFILITLFYIIPLPANLVKFISGPVYNFRREYALEPAAWQTLSVYPRATMDYVVKITTYFMVFLVALSKIISPATPAKFERYEDEAESDINSGRNKGMLHAFLTLGALTSILSLLIHSLVDFNLHIPANALYFSVILAIAAGLSLTRKEYSFNYGFIEKLINIVIAIGFMVAVFSIIQRFSYNQKIYWIIEKAGSHFGPYVNYDHYAGFMEMCSFLSISYFIGYTVSSSFPRIKRMKDKILWFSSKEANKTLIYLFLSVVMVSSLFFSTSRGGIISFVIALVIFSYLILMNIRKEWRKKLVLSFIFMIVFMCIMIIWIGPEETITQFKLLDTVIKSIITEGPILGELRPTIWRNTIELVKDYPIFGSGLGTYVYMFPAYRTFDHTLGLLIYAHNDYLQLISEMGLFGYVTILAFFWWYFKKLKICLRRIKNEWK